LGVRRDPGDTFIWIAVGLGLVGLAITFYVPRRRLWLRVRDGRLAIAGTGERTAKMEREFAELAKEAGL
jgi:cytochrome c biogenesis protein ResB